jgi:hypothetical protein
MKKAAFLLFLLSQAGSAAGIRDEGQEACFVGPGGSNCPQRPYSPYADPNYQADRIRREEDSWYPTSLLDRFQDFHTYGGLSLRDVPHEEPLTATSAAARARGLQELIDLVQTLRNTIDLAEGPMASFFQSLQPKFKQLADQRRMDANDLEAQFRTDRFGWPDSQRTFHDRTKDLLFKEKWIEANWGPAFARPDLVVSFLTGSGSQGLKDHYTLLMKRIGGVLNQFNSVPYVSVGAMPTLLYVPIKNSIFVWPKDEANVPIPPNGLAPNPAARMPWPNMAPDPLPRMPFGMTGSERILLSTLDRKYQIKIHTLDLSLVNLNFPACKAEADAAVADIKKLDQEILLRSGYYSAAKRGPQIAAALDLMKSALPEANSLQRSTARLSSLLATLSEKRLEPLSSFEAWQKAINEDFSTLPQSLRDEASGLSNLIQAARWLGEFSAEPGNNGLWHYEEPLVGFASILEELLERAFNQEDPSALVQPANHLQAEVSLAVQQLDFEVKRLTQMDPSEGPDSGQHLTDAQIDAQVTALGGRAGQLLIKCRGRPATVLPQ